MNIQNLDDLLVHELQDLYDAEQRIYEALPRLRGAATSPDLTSAIDQRRDAIEAHLEQLEAVFETLGHAPGRDTCEATVGLIREADDLLNDDIAPDVMDAALIAAIQRIAHYKIAGYGTARSYAMRLGQYDAQQTLQALLDASEQFDARLTELAQMRNSDAMA